MTDVPITDQEVPQSEIDRAKSLLDRARGGTANRAISPPRENTPAFSSVIQQEGQPVPRPGLPTMQPGELAQRLQTGEAVGGVGAAYEQNQPSAPARGLRRETVQGLNALAEAQAAPAPPPQEEIAPTEEGAAPDVEEDGLSAEEVEATLRSIQGRTVFSPIRDLFDNDRRVALEKDLPPLSISDILINQDARQAVPLTKGLHITYRSLNGHETDYIEKFIWERFQGDLTQQIYAMTRSLAALTLSVVSVGKQKMPECRTEGGSVDDKLFETKWRALLRWPGFVLEAADINRVWFEERCAQLLDVGAVGNG